MPIIENLDGNCNPQQTQQKSAVMKLDRYDMGLFGVCPETDTFSAVVCEMCNAVIKPQGLKSHMILRHNYRRDTNVTSNTSSLSCSSRIPRSSSVALFNTTHGKSKYKQTVVHEDETDRQVSSNTFTTKLGKRIYHKPGRNINKLIPIKDRDYTPDMHCGVLSGDPPKPCTRSLTCKSHTLHSRRSVSGRTKTFDKLLHEHRSSKSVVSSTVDIDSESSNSNSSSLNSASYDDTVTSTTNITTPIENDNHVSSTVPNTVSLVSSLPPPPSVVYQSISKSEYSLSFSDSDVDIEGGEEEARTKLCKSSYDDESKSSSPTPCKTLPPIKHHPKSATFQNTHVNFCNCCYGLITSEIDTENCSQSLHLPLRKCGKCVSCTSSSKCLPCCHGIRKPLFNSDCGIIEQFIVMQCSLKCGFNVVVPICPKTNYLVIENVFMKQTSAVLTDSIPIECKEFSAESSSHSSGLSSRKAKYFFENDQKNITRKKNCSSEINCIPLIDIFENIRLERERRIRIVQPQKILTKRVSLTNKLKQNSFSIIALNMMAHALITKRSDPELAILSIEVHVNDDNDIYLVVSGVNDEHMRDKFKWELINIIHTIHSLIKINVFLNDNTHLPHGMLPSVYNKYKQILNNTENLTFNDITQTHHLINSNENLVNAVLHFFKLIIFDRQKDCIINTISSTDSKCKKLIGFKSGITTFDPAEEHQCYFDNKYNLSFISKNDNQYPNSNNNSLIDKSQSPFPDILTLSKKKIILSQHISNNSRRRDFPGVRKWFRTIPKPISLNMYAPLQRSGGGLVLSRRLHSFRRSVQNNFSQNNNNIIMNRNQVVTSTHVNSCKNYTVMNNSVNRTIRFYSVGSNRNSKIINKTARDVSSVKHNKTSNSTIGKSKQLCGVKAKSSILRKLSNANRLSKYLKKIN